MRALVMEGFGPPEDARMAELDKPGCRPGDVLVRLAAAAVNPTDWKECEGSLAGFYPPYPARWALGFDGSGIVETVGSEVGGFRIGDRVMLISDRRQGHSGTFAEYARVDRSTVAPMPRSLRFVEAATISNAGITGYQALTRPDMGAAVAGQSVLVHGAAGGMGSFIICYAKALGLAVAATSRPANADYVRDLGADHVIDYTRGDIIGDLRAWSPDGVDLPIDCVSVDRLSPLTLKPGGKLIVICTATHDGELSDRIAEAEAAGRALLFCILDLSIIAEGLVETSRLLDSGLMRMPAVTVYPFERSGEALVALRRGHVRGKVAIEIATLD